MANINGWWFIIIGVIVSFTSKFLVEGLEIFVYVGYIFLGYGLIKVLLSYLTSKKNKSNKKHHTNHQNNSHKNKQAHSYQSYTQNSNGNQQQQAHHNRKQTHPHQNPNSKVMFCRNCGKPYAIQDNFCGHCGLRLK